MFWLYECNVWMQCMNTMFECNVWMQCMNTMYECFVWMLCMNAVYECNVRIQCLNTMYECEYFLPSIDRLMISCIYGCLSFSVFNASQVCQMKSDFRFQILKNPNMQKVESWKQHSWPKSVTENDVCRFQVVIVHRLGGVPGTDRQTDRQTHALSVLYYRLEK